MILLCCQSQPFFINQLAVYPSSVGISEGFSSGLRFTTIWYSVDVSVHDTNKRCSHYASCFVAELLELAALRNSQVAANIHRPGFNLTQEDIHLSGIKIGGMA